MCTERWFKSANKITVGDNSVSLAPLLEPHKLAPINIAMSFNPDLPQVARLRLELDEATKRRRKAGDSPRTSRRTR